MIKKKSSIMDAGVYRVPKPSQKHQNNYKKLMIAMTLSMIFIVAELVGGIISHSIAVISDCLHLVTDLIGFIISFIALRYSVKKSTRLNSFGFHRVEIIGVLANLFIIWSLTLVVVIEAVQRVIQKAIVENPKVMLIVAGGGLGVNLLMYFILHSGGHSHLSHSHCKGHTHTDTHQKYLNDGIKEQTEEGDIKQQISIKDQVQEKHEHNHQKQCNHQHHDHAHDQHSHHHHHQHNPQHGNHEHVSEVQNNLNQPLIINNETIETTENISSKHQSNEKQNNLAPPSAPKKSKKKKTKKVQIHSHSDHKGHHHAESESHAHSHSHSHKKDKQHDNLSMKAAILHALTDIIQSIGLLIAALLIYFCGSDHGAVVTEYNAWHLLDPISTFVFSILVIVSTFPITKECFHIILEATPSDVDEQNLHKKFRQTKGVLDLHDFHVWSLKPGSLLLSAHVFCLESQEKRVLQRLTVICRQHKIYHSTIQVEAIDKLNYKSPVICQNDIH